jgi:hypothetical protein
VLTTNICARRALDLVPLANTSILAGFTLSRSLEYKHERTVDLVPDDDQSPWCNPASESAPSIGAGQALQASGNASCRAELSISRISPGRVSIKHHAGGWTRDSGERHPYQNLHRE